MDVRVNPTILNKNNKEIYAKQKEYISYIDEHITNVKKAWSSIKRSCKTYLAYMCHTSDFNLMEHLIETHDRSKFSAEEFEPYRKNFYPINDEEKENNKDAFEEAWVHHYMNNPHHWNYWSVTGREDEMPFTFVVEMVCDWQAMGYKFGNTPEEFYEKNKDKIVLGKKQKLWLEELFTRMREK